MDADVHGDFGETNGLGCCEGALNNDEAKFLGGRCTDDSSVFIGSHRAVVLGTERVGGFVGRSSCRWVVVCQTDHEIIQTIRYKMIESRNQETLPPQTDRATRYVSHNLVISEEENSTLIVIPKQIAVKELESYG